MSVAFILTVILNGVLSGLVYGLAALGFALIFGAVRVVNVAHGGVMVAGMMMVTWLVAPRGAQAFHVDPLLAVPAVAMALFVVGGCFHRLLIARVPEMPEARRLLVMAGVAVMMTGVLALALGVASRGGLSAGGHLPVSGEDLAFGAMKIDRPRLRAALLALMAIGVLFFFFNVSRTGKEIRACADNPFGAQVVGLNLPRLQAITFGLGIAITGAAGGLLAQSLEVRPTLIADCTVTGLTIVLIGGLGNIGGALLGGVLMGVCEVAAGVMLPPSLKSLVGYGLLLTVLLVRPCGVVGERR